MLKIEHPAEEVQILSFMMNPTKFLNKIFMFFKFSPVLAFFFLLNSACNKVVEEVPLPPFSVFPNPCTDVFSVLLDNNYYMNNPAYLQLLDGNEVLLELRDLTPATNINISMVGKAPGIYYLKVSGDRRVFTVPVIKVD